MRLTFMDYALCLAQSMALMNIWLIGGLVCHRIFAPDIVQEIFMNQYVLVPAILTTMAVFVNMITLYTFDTVKNCGRACSYYGMR